MLSFFFVSFASSINSLKTIFEGDWTGESIYSKTSKFKDISASVKAVNGKLELRSGKFTSTIRVSDDDLSGNFTFNNELIKFNFSKISPPFVSTDVVINNVKVHISFASQKNIKFVLVYEDGSTDTIVMSKTFQTKENLILAALPGICSWGSLLVMPVILVLGIKKRLAKEEEEEKAKQAHDKKTEEKLKEESKEEEKSEENEKVDKNVADGIVHRK